MVLLPIKEYTETGQTAKPQNGKVFYWKTPSPQFSSSAIPPEKMQLIQR